MKFLVTTCPAPGHLFLLVPMAWALRNAGHEVLVPVPPHIGAAAAGTGLATTPVADVDMMEVMARNFAPALREGVEKLDPAQRAAYAVRSFTELAERAADDVVAIARDWRPDVVVHDAIEFAGPLAAALLDVPTIAVGWGTWLRPPVTGLVEQALVPLYQRFDAEPGGGRAPIERVDVCPRSMRDDPSDALLDARFEPYNGSVPTPRHLIAPPRGRRICVTVGGTVGSHQHLAGALLRLILAGLSDVDAEIVLALADVDIAELGTLPANARVERWLPLNQVLPTSDLVIHHGGSGTSMTAARYGVPQLMFPQLADQFRFAGRLAELGAGRVLDGRAASPEQVRAAVDHLLGDADVRGAAERLAKEISSATPLAELVPAFENATAR